MTKLQNSTADMFEADIPPFLDRRGEARIERRGRKPKARFSKQFNTIPVRVAGDIKMFDFHGNKIPTFEADGERWVAMKPVVQAIGFWWASQAAKLKNPIYMCRLYRHASNGGVQEMMCIPLKAYPIWLNSINAKRVEPEKRPGFILFQQTSVEALFQFWMEGKATIESVKSAMLKQRAVKEPIKSLPSPDLNQAKGEIMGFVTKHVSVPMNFLASLFNEKFTYIDERLRASHVRDGMIIRELQEIRRLLDGLPTRPAPDPEAAAWLG